MRILGIDPGTRVVGYGFIDRDGSTVRAVVAGAIRAPASQPLERRLAHIAGELRELLAVHGADQAAMEDVFVDVDPRSAIKIGMGRGALMAVLGEAALPVASYPPATVKKAVAAHGRAPKEQVARMVGAILGLPGPPEPLDATDALAIAITHALRMKAK